MRVLSLQGFSIYTPLEILYSAETLAVITRGGIYQRILTVLMLCKYEAPMDVNAHLSNLHRLLYSYEIHFALLPYTLR